MKENQFAKSAICQIYLILYPKIWFKKKKCTKGCVGCQETGPQKKMSFSGEKMYINIANIFKGRAGWGG